MPISISVNRKRKGRSKPVKQAHSSNEMTRLGAALRALGGMGGSMVGGLIGQPAGGASVGTGLGAALSRWLGSGDYTVKENSIVQSSLKGSAGIPSMHRTDQTVVVRHREFLTTVLSSTAYLNQVSFSLNPGLRQTFPWLSAIAANYQEYKLRGVVFHYVPTSGAATGGSNTALGSVMLQTAYRASDTAPTNKYELLNEFWSNEVLPSETMAHPIECKASETVLGSRYIRDGAVTDDLMFYDYGITTLATQGQQTTGQVIGDLWVTYEVELRKPRMYASLGKAVNVVRGINSVTNVLRPLTGTLVSDNSFVGTPSFTCPSDNTMVVTIPAGNAGAYVYSFWVTGGTAMSWTGTVTATIVNGTPLVNAIEGTTQGTTISTTTRCVTLGGFRITDPTSQTTVTLTGLTLASAGSPICNMYISAADADFSQVW